MKSSAVGGGSCIDITADHGHEKGWHCCHPLLVIYRVFSLFDSIC